MVQSQNPQRLFQRYVSHLLQNRREKCSGERYFFSCDLPPELRQQLLDENQDFLSENNLCPLKGQLLYINSESLTPILILYGYQPSMTIDNCGTYFGFQGMGFSVDNWPSDFDPKKYIHNPNPIPWFSGASLSSTSPYWIETMVNPCNNSRYLSLGENYTIFYQYLKPNKMFDYAQQFPTNGYLPIIWDLQGLSRNVKNWIQIPLPDCSLLIANANAHSKMEKKTQSLLR